MSYDKTPIKRVRFTPIDQQTTRATTVINNVDDRAPQKFRIYNTHHRETVTITISVEYLFTPTPKRCTGSNTMYSQRKGNSYVLFDCPPESTAWTVVTNNHRFKDATPYTFQ